MRSIRLSHQNNVNRFCHTVGIPIIALSLMLTPILFLNVGLWKILAGVFIGGWVLQFIGHTVEGKPPESFKDWRFLFVGLRWWFAKIRGRA